MNKALRVTACECRTKLAQIFRRAAAGETIIVTNKGVPQPVAAGMGGSEEELRRMQEAGRG